jgi:uncharacterized MAPEG superfamily protein
MSARSFYEQILAATGKGTPNYSMYAPPAMWILNMIPHFLAILVFSGGKWPNKNPREFLAKALQKQNKTHTEKLMLRAEAVQMNGFENIGWFSAAIVAANVARLPAEELNSLAGLYLATRLAFSVLYIGTENEVLSYLRSGAYVSGVGVIFTMFIRAGRAFQ